jgi:hypothetical protein
MATVLSKRGGLINIARRLSSANGAIFTASLGQRPRISIKEI